MALWEIIKSGDTDALKKALGAGVPSYELNQGIQAATQKNDLEMMKLILEAKPPWSAVGSAIGQAAERGYCDIVKLLLSGKFRINKSLLPAIMNNVVENDDKKILGMLLDAGLDINGLGEDTEPLGRPEVPDGQNTVLAAIRSKNLEILKLLIHAGADLNFVTKKIRKPLDLAREIGDEEIIKLLEVNGASEVTPADLDFKQAAWVGNLERVLELLPETTEQERNIVMKTASFKGHNEIVKAVMDHEPGEVDLSAALIQASRSGNIIVVMDLLAQKPGLEAKEFGETALMASAKNGHIPIVGLLLGSGAKTDAKADWEGNTPLILAAKENHLDAVRLLLDKGAEPNRRNDEGKTALDYAKMNGNDEIRKLLEDNGGETVSRAALVRRLKAKMKKKDLVRMTYPPKTKKGAPGTKGSKFGGIPYLHKGEEWPLCPTCKKPFTFFLQLLLSDLPKDLQGRFGEGMFQMFFCTYCFPHRSQSKEMLLRLVDPTGEVGKAQIPEDLKAFPARAITGWQKPKQDLPNREAGSEAHHINKMELEPHEFEMLIEFNRQGDKLGGWPNWVQDMDYPHCPKCKALMGNFLFQLDSNYNLPFMWGDNGAGYIFQCPHHHDELAFVWQCG